jgi:hypothetical protein
MTSAIWTLLYDIAPSDREEYIAWFHDVHIPDKLARPGYEWAGHYQATGDNPNRYVAFFGGTDTRVFFDPSPSQLKAGQDELTQKMIGMRRNPSGLIFSEEWKTKGPAFDERPGTAIEFLCCDVAGADEALNMWLVQDDMPTFEKTEGAVRGRTLLSATGPAKHAVLYQFATPEDAEGFTRSRVIPNKVTSALACHAETPFIATRLWPLLD